MAAMGEKFEMYIWRSDPGASDSHKIWHENGRLMTCHVRCMQGDIESVAAMGAQELTTLFEQISGSDGFRLEYEDLEKQKVAADERLTFNFAKKRTAAQDRKAKKEQKDEAERHIKLQEELVGFRAASVLHFTSVASTLLRPLSLT